MVNYPNTSSVAVSAARKHLDRILRAFSNGGASTKLALAGQFQHFAYSNEGSKSPTTYPSTLDSAAVKARAEIATLSRHMHSQAAAGRIEIAEQCKAAVLSVGGVIAPTLGTSTSVTRPAVGVGESYSTNVRDAVPTVAYAMFVNWSLDGKQLPNAGGLGIMTPATDEQQIVVADVCGMDGSTFAVTWTLPPAGVTNATTTITVPFIGDAAHGQEIGFRKGLFGETNPTIVHGVEVVTITTLTATAPGVVIEFTQPLSNTTFNAVIGAVPVVFSINAAIPGGTSFTCNSTTARDTIRFGMLTDVPVDFPDVLTPAG